MGNINDRKCVKRISEPKKNKKLPIWQNVYLRKIKSEKWREANNYPMDKKKKKK